MQQRECAFGHLYDADQYGSCPYCNSKSPEIVFGKENRTVAPGMSGPRREDRAGEIPPTKPGPDYRNPMEDPGRTKSGFEENNKYDPVVGWLVCIEGSRKGKGYELRNKINGIGRDPSNDISFPNDTLISRKNHVRLAYDNENNNFHLIPGESTNIVYVNGTPLFASRALEAYDVIKMGEIKLIFVPLCSEKFTWEQK